MDCSTSSDVPEASVVIPAYNAEATIGLQIEALGSQVEPPRFEVILVDNMSSDRTNTVAREVAASFGVPMRIVRAFEFQGPGYSRNVGAASARADKLMFCDADDVVSATWLRNGSAALDACDLWSGSCHLLSDEEVAGELSEVRSRFDGRPAAAAPQEAEARSFPVLMGGNFGMRRMSYCELGGFDSAMVAQGDDNEFALRAQISGVRICEASSAVIGYRGKWSVRDRMKVAFGAGRAHAVLASRYRMWDRSQHPHWAIGVPRALADAARMIVIPSRRDFPASAARISAAAAIAVGYLRFEVFGSPPLESLGDGMWRQRGRL